MSYLVNGKSLKEAPQRCSCKRESAFFVREFVNTISFVIREKKKYRSLIREN